MWPWLCYTYWRCLAYEPWLFNTSTPFLSFACAMTFEHIGISSHISHDSSTHIGHSSHKCHDFRTRIGYSSEMCYDSWTHIDNSSHMCHDSGTYKGNSSHTWHGSRTHIGSASHMHRDSWTHIDNSSFMACLDSWKNRVNFSHIWHPAPLICAMTHMCHDSYVPWLMDTYRQFLSYGIPWRLNPYGVASFGRID